MINMDLPRAAANCPAKVELEPGKNYAFCTCGLSANQPFCDGAHKGSDFKPQIFTVPEAKTAFLCQCKKTANAPFCDGAHKQLPQATPTVAE
jgi:CDGSH-type Zn-finger protein